jgi:hypothetical protein
MNKLADPIIDDEMSPLDILRCAQANFVNFELLCPAVGRNPLYLIAKTQLDAGVKALEVGNA